LLQFEGVAILKKKERQKENEVQRLLEQEIESFVESEVELKVENIEQELEQNTGQEQEENMQKRPIRKYKQMLMRTMVIFGMVFMLYFVGTVYFINHFCFASEINCVSVSAKSVTQAEQLMTSKLQDYTLTLKEVGGKSEQIRASEVGLTYPSLQTFNQLKQRQKPFSWIFPCFGLKSSKMTVGVTYDEALLRQCLEQLSGIEVSTIIEPKNASFSYVDGHYNVVEAVYGNKLDKERLYDQVSQALLNEQREIDLEAARCYIQPQYHSNSPKIIEVNETLNRYVATSITYIFGNDQEVLDGAVISEWLTVDENFEIIVDEDKVEGYISELSNQYDTAGRTRTFVTSLGETIQVSGGDYSEPINISAEAQDVISTIKQGLTRVKEPVYGQNTVSYGNADIGNTYVEINLTQQHIWFYKEGSLIVDGDIVTGDVRKGDATPPGVYRLKYKVKNVVLRGPGYASPVRFWMPFNGGIGMHDANWKRSFGGEIYKTNGSHGCINCPDGVAEAIYNNIDAGTPVICY
jgi:lipoprotein-anchoring transpeptidase ErfK/SrfK